MLALTKLFKARMEILVLKHRELSLSTTNSLMMALRAVKSFNPEQAKELLAIAIGLPLRESDRLELVAAINGKAPTQEREAAGGSPLQGGSLLRLRS